MPKVLHSDAVDQSLPQAGINKVSLSHAYKDYAPWEYDPEWTIHKMYKHVPNDLTRMEMEATLRGEGLCTVASLDDLFNHLDDED